MGIGSTDLALTTSRLGCARLGAARLGFIPEDVDDTGVYNWKEIKPPTTQWILLTENSVCGKRPVASFTAAPNPTRPGTEVQFTDTSTPAADITYWHWDFGDGNESYEQHPKHAYATSAVYTVTLSISSRNGSDTATGTVTVTAYGLFVSTRTWFYDYIPTGEGAEAGYDGWDGGSPPGDYLDTRTVHDTYLAAIIRLLTGLTTGARVLLVCQIPLPNVSRYKFNSEFQAALTRLGHTFEVTAVDFGFGLFDPLDFDLVCIDDHSSRATLDAYIDAGGAVLSYVNGDNWERYGITTPATLQTYTPEPKTRSVTLPSGGPYSYVVWSDSETIDPDIVTTKTRPGTTAVYQNDLGEYAVATWMP